MNATLRNTINADLCRYWGDASRSAFWRALRQIPGFRYTYLMRCCAHYRQHKSPIRYYVFRVMLEHYRFKYGFDIPHQCKIGPGFYVGHFGGVVINEDVVLGSNVNISQGVTLGQTNRGKKQGTPVIGDRVWIGPNAVVVGKIRVGNNVLIAPGAYVHFDVPDNAVVVGNPGSIVSYEGTASYIVHTAPC